MQTSGIITVHVYIVALPKAVRYLNFSRSQDTVSIRINAIILDSMSREEPIFLISILKS